jgi:hypothetical protein
MGRRFVDHVGVMARPANIRVLIQASRERFLEMLRAAVSR